MRQPRRWISEEDDMLRRHVSEKGRSWCAWQLNRSYSAVSYRTRKLGLKPKKVRAWRRWTAEEEAFISQHYATYGPHWCAERLPGRSRKNVSDKAHRMRRRDKAVGGFGAVKQGPLMEELYLLGLDMKQVSIRIGAPYDQVRGYLTGRGVHQFRRWQLEQQANEVMQKHGAPYTEQLAVGQEGP